MSSEPLGVKVRSVFLCLETDRLAHCVEIIGSGGKTSFMLNFIKAFGGGDRVNIIYTTSTHLAWPWKAGSSGPERDEGGVPYPGELIEWCGDLDDLPALQERWNQSRAPRLWGLVRPNSERSKWVGLDPEELDSIGAWRGLDFLVVEADGSRQLPVKAHACHEPVLYSRADLGVAVIGLKGLRRRIREGEVHRPQLMAQFLECPLDTVIGPEEFVRLACAYLNKLPTEKKLLVLSQAEGWKEGALQNLGVSICNCYGQSTRLVTPSKGIDTSEPLTFDLSAWNLDEAGLTVAIQSKIFGCRLLSC